MAIHRLVSLLPLAISVSVHAQVTSSDEETLVLTAMPVTYSVSAALAEGTSIRVVNVPERGRTMNAQASFFAAQASRMGDLFGQADAVVSIGKLWREDPLYEAARAANIRVVDIDATKPWASNLEGVSVILEPQGRIPWQAGAVSGSPERAPSVYFWLSPANGARMAEIVARDLARLSPSDAAQIEANLARYREELLGLKREYEVKLARLIDVTVFALAREFVYLTTDMGLFVDGYFLKQDIHWTETDLDDVRSYLLESGIKVVIHKWEPEPPIRTAIEAAGATLVVLDMVDAGIVEDGRLTEDGYQRILRQNLEALYTALVTANEL